MPKTLILGGSSFMGRGTVEAFIARGDEVTVVNRGKTKDPFGDRVSRINVDRNDRSAFRAALAKAGSVDHVVDFSAFTPSHVADVVNTMNGKLRHYVFISTQAVYQSPDWDAAKPQEEEATFDLHVPEKRRGAYGWDKRACEELLESAYVAGGFPSTRIRIPIINGPHDPTYRLWRYHAWMQSGHPVYVTRGADKRYSTCYSGDVVSGVLAALASGKTSHGKAYHLQQAERPNIEEVLDAMAASGVYPVPQGGKRVRVLSEEQVAAMSKDDLKKIRFWSHLDGMHQEMSIKKARAELSWTPTPQSEWYRRCVEWYATGESDLPTDRAPFNDEALMQRMDKLWKQDAAPDAKL